MNRVRKIAARLVRGDASDRLDAELGELRERVEALAGETERLRREVHEAVTDLTGRVGALSDRLEQTGA